MPENRPGRGVHVKNGSTAINHADPVKNSNYVGQAIKQKGVGWELGLDAQAVIAKDEEYFLVTKGLVVVDEVSGNAKGDAIYITSENVLTKTKGENTPFGRVYNVAGERGLPTGKVRIDLDAKDSF